MTLWLVRHGQPLIDAGVCYGALDVPADHAATEQAAQALAAVLPWQCSVVTSTLQRCELLGKVLQGLRPDLAYKTDARLVEMNFGCWEGQRWDAIPPEAYARWTADFGKHRFGGQESVSDFMRRVASAWDEVQLARRDAVWITHAGVIRAAMLLAQGVRQIEVAAKWPQSAPAFGCWCELQC